MVSSKGGGVHPLNVTDCRPAIPHFREHHSVLPAESALKRKQGAPLKRRLAQGLKKSEASPPKAHSPVKNLTIQAGALSECLWPGRASGFGGREH